MALLDRNTISLADGDVLIDVDPEQQFVQVRMGKEKAAVKKTDLWAAIFAIADPETQAEMMPVRQTEAMHYTKVHQVRATKDIHKGDLLKVRCHMNVPLTVVEGLKGMVEKETKKGILLPR